MLGRALEKCNKENKNGYKGGSGGCAGQGASYDAELLAKKVLLGCEVGFVCLQLLFAGV